MEESMEFFRLSDDLTRRILDRFEHELKKTYDEIPSDALEMLEQSSRAWGEQHIVGMLGIFAWRAVHGISGAGRELCFIKDGEFPTELWHYAANQLPLTHDADGVLLMREIAREFMEWLQRDDTRLLKLAAVESYRFDGNDLYIIVREKPETPSLPTLSPLTVLKA
jgi:hypothetical protein